ncbi:MAG: thioredoxin domain-containing protein [Porphyromonas sp.]|nr:thioredoxin domain-containing protein [Porphyromonas sp.]
MSIAHLTKAEFSAQIHDVDLNPTGWEAKHELPVLIDFYATWCPPCKALAPLLEELQTELAGKIQIYKIDVDAEEELTALYNIRTVPTLLFAHPSDDKPTLMLGVMGKGELMEQVNKLLLK